MSNFSDAGLISTKDLISLAKDKGLDLNLRKLRFYVSEGLIPQSKVLPVASLGRAGFYPKSVIYTLSLIFSMHKQGYTLKEIKLFLERVDKVAKLENKSTQDLYKELLDLFESKEETIFNSSLWDEASRIIFEEMLKKNCDPKIENIKKVTLSVEMKDGTNFSKDLFNFFEKFEIKQMQLKNAVSIKQLVNIASQRDGKILTFLTDPEIQFNEFKKYHYVTDIQNYLAAIKNGEVVGFVGIRGEEIRLKKGMALLDGPLVSPDFRNKGVATKLMNNLFIFLKNKKIKTVDVLLPTTCIPCLQFLRRRFNFNIFSYLWMMQLSSSENLKHTATNKQQIIVNNYQKEKDLKLFVRAYNESGFDWWLQIPVNLEDMRKEEKEGSIINFDSVFLAYDGLEPVGFSYFTAKEPLLYFRVIKEYRRRHIEDLLVEKALKYAKANKFPFVYTVIKDNETENIEMLERAGFKLDKMVIFLRKEI